MTLILDSGGITALAGDRDRLGALHRRNLWPPQVPAGALTEALTGDHRRDVAVNRLLRGCWVVAVDEATARTAARLRTATRRAGSISAVDAIVVAMAEDRPNPIVVTSDPDDIRALAVHASRPIIVEGV